MYFGVNMKQNYAIACLLSLSLCLPLCASATPIGDIFVFGDSLSDQGSISMLTGGSVPGPDYFNGRFSNGPIYTDFMAQRLGLPLSPAPIFPSAWSAGRGNNFAYGGARTDSHRSGLPLGLNSQVSAFLNGVTTSDSDSLYTVFAGANDIQDAIGVANDNLAEAAAALADPATAIASVESAALNVANAISNLSEAGAVRFFVPNSANWALVPAVTEIGSTGSIHLAGYGDFARDVSVAFNKQLALELSVLTRANPAIDIVSFDFFGLVEDIVDNPGDYGFTDITMSCYEGDDLFFTGGGTACANPDKFLFWDRVHPTTAAHAVFSSQFISAIPEPPGLALFLLGLLGFIVRYREYMA